MDEKTAVKKPKETVGINNASIPPKAAKPSANELLGRFLLENNIVLMIDTLDKSIETISSGGIIINKPRITAIYKNA